MAETSIESKQESSSSISQGFKLFGATIPLMEINKEVKEEAIERSTTTTTTPTTISRPEKAIPCPRCKSMETKFCYFNNYNVNQPRHFCKGCQRYWTAGGSLRNVPVGAGRRKTKPAACHGALGFSGECVFDAPTSVSEIEFDRVVVEQWHMAASPGGFRHVFPGKRHCTGSASQIC
ncbi:hypothetical protein Scep_011619 [Stephania cephalantha]|uniref:Dof-type domain-containing protein n=1 Tax=Stephania cephalantha TaxID=152367 RepID=A0AAP0JF51_9MAGN